MPTREQGQVCVVGACADCVTGAAAATNPCRHFVAELNAQDGTRLLDVAGGTGDIAFRCLERAGATASTGPLVTVCDINAAMLEQGKVRATQLGPVAGRCTWVEGSAEELPFPDASFDAYTISFGIRNVTNIDKALEEAHRVLVPGGRFMCLEFSQVSNPALRAVYDKYSFEVIPVMGEVIAGDMPSYQYLVESIREFPDQQKFATMIKAAGFQHVTYENLTGGVAAMHSGFKF
jgi:ubiquinone/menaquinone biosynthesis methyltransferase